MSKKRKAGKRKGQGRRKNYPVPNRTYKSTVFIMLFRDKKNLLELYNAVSGKQYTDPEKLTINTLENAIYMAMKNDLSFIIDSRLSLYEHQFTYSPNLPLRMLMYLSDVYEEMTRKCNVYGREKVLIPPPQFLIFYNGKDRQPDRQELRLSDLYAVPAEETWLELKAVMVNVNAGHSPGLLEACQTLKEYSLYVDRVRRHAQELPVKEAVERAIRECIDEGILAEFLEKNRAEARKMSIYEYDQERHMRQEREQSYEKGHAQGFMDGHAQGLAEGQVQGVTDGKRSMAVNLARFGMATEEIARIAEADAELVREWIRGL